MLRFLLMTLHWMTVSAALQQWTPVATGPQQDVVQLNVSKCRSPNMEEFTCQWTPLDSEENITYTLNYKIGDGIAQECPDYVSGGPNTCYFNTKYTQIWDEYCLIVTAHTRTGPITSPKYCLDVVDIVETDPPFNLTYSILKKCIDDAGNTVLVSWLYPIAPQVNGGWITLEYELRYRQLSDPDQWKVKERLHDPSLELLDLPMGSYEVMVRCRSTKSKLWSRWSDPIYFTITTGLLPVRKRQNTDVVQLNVSKCRSPNMEEFTCQWTPLDSEENISYTLNYKIGDGVARECPDYVTGGPNTCYFDAKHTQIWEVYCLNVTAHTRTGPITSPKHCIDVVDIVETDPPFNLTYSVLNKSVDDAGNTVLVSWLYPIASHVNGGWITLEYELRYRKLSDPDHWKVKERLRDPSLELLDLPMGSYEVMVRCRSTKNKLWSRWSDPIYFNITTGRLPVHMMVFMLVTAIAIMTFLIIGFGVIPRGKSIKAYLLSPIPKPRIQGLDPMLIKKGKIDEINHHFSSFHGYKSPQYCIETWYQVSVDANPATTLDSFLSYYKQEDKANGKAFPQHQPLLQTNWSPTEYCHRSAERPESHCDTSTWAEEPPQNPAEAWPELSQIQPELMSFPGTDYTVILNSDSADTAVIQPAHHDFYTCVSDIAPTGVVRLVPCLPDPLKNMPYLQFKNEPDDDEDSDKSVQLAALLKKQMEMLSGSDDAGDTEQKESAVPLPPHSVDQN